MSLSAAGPRAPDLSGRALDGRYELHHPLGEGTFGRVYRGLDRRLARAVAIKVIKPWWAEDPQWVRRFEREAQLMASVTDHGIVQIFDVGQAPEGLYYVAELVAGESVDARLRRGPMGIDEARDVAEQLSEALGSAHAARIVHGDVKPANVLISSTGKVKVTDFGLARLLGTGSAPMSSTIAGTPSYMAPEQARGRPTQASDVYSAGVVLYEMLSGRPPFEGDAPVELALRHLQDPPPPLPASVPADLAAVVTRALAKNPDERYRDGAQLAGALAGAAEARGSAGGSTPGVSPPQSSKGGAGGSKGVLRTLVAPVWSSRRDVDPAGRRRTAAVFGLVLLVLAGLLAGALLSGSKQARVPNLRGLPAAALSTKLTSSHLRLRLRHRYSAAPAGTVVSQKPAAGASVDAGTRVLATLSAGRRPVQVPRVIGFSSADAQSAIRQLGLRPRIQLVPALGAAVGSVTGQTPAAYQRLRPGLSVSLSVAEAPRWRDVLSFRSQDGRSSGPFQIRGARWRIVYRMSYTGTCTFIFFCSGPTARVANLTRGGTVGSFGLNSGTGQTQTFSTGPGSYQVNVTPGQDTATWSAEVQDYY